MTNGDRDELSKQVAPVDDGFARIGSHPGAQPAAAPGTLETYDTLCGTWGDASDALRLSPSISTAVDEQASYDALIDFVEDYGFAGSPLDPRNASYPTLRRTALSA